MLVIGEQVSPLLSVGANVGLVVGTATGAALVGAVLSFPPPHQQHASPGVTPVSGLAYQSPYEGHPSPSLSYA